MTHLSGGYGWRIEDLIEHLDRHHVEAFDDVSAILEDHLHRAPGQTNEMMLEALHKRLHPRPLYAQRIQNVFDRADYESEIRDAAI